MALDDQITWGCIERPHYALCMLYGAQLAKSLGFVHATVIEFGVAGGNGLVAMEKIAPWIERESGVHLEIVGFDNKTGLPATDDFRDLPYCWRAGHFPMDEDALRGRLRRSRLALGDVAETLSAFLAASDAPVCAVVFDLDLYSSTVAALRLFDAGPAKLLPRIPCYFDDVSGEGEIYSDFTGERAAIREFNDASKDRKISPFYGARDRVRRRDGVMCFHYFTHPAYTRFVGGEDARLDLR